MDHTLLGSSTTERYGCGRLVTVVDDDLTTLEAIQAILEYDGYEVRAFADATSAELSFASARPNLVILDMMLRGRRGSALLESLRLAPATAEIPVIVCTAAALEPGNLERLEQLECLYIAKPFELDDLLQAARQLTRR